MNKWDFNLKVYSFDLKKNKIIATLFDKLSIQGDKDYTQVYYDVKKHNYLIYDNYQNLHSEEKLYSEIKKLPILFPLYKKRNSFYDVYKGEYMKFKDEH